MIKAFCKFWFKITGWKLVMPTDGNIDRCVLLAAPHTSNYDALLMVGGLAIGHTDIRFTIKKEWLRFPFRRMMRNVGALGIDRSPKNPGDKRPSMVEVMTDLFKKHKKLTLIVTPEGTRSLAEKWKSGFYWVAKEAGVPIGLGFLDYATKRGGVEKLIYPTDFEKDMREIMAYYKNMVAKFPENFSVDLNYV